MERIKMLLFVMCCSILFYGCGGGKERSEFPDPALATSTEQPSEEAGGNTGEANPGVQGNNVYPGLPYYELAFSLNDLKVAGYSVNDGAHLDEVLEAVSAELPSFPGDIPSGTRYDGWSYSPTGLESGQLNIFHTIRGNSTGNIRYTISDLAWTGTELDKGITIGYNARSAEVPMDEYPLLTCRVLPRSSYEDTISNYQLSELVELAQSSSEGYRFESQYGEMICSYYEFGDALIGLDILSPAVNFRFQFRHGLLEQVEYSFYYK